jgi:hypothetical protein
MHGQNPWPETDTPTSWEPYETGSEAVSRHDYDPKEVAAAMMLMHLNSHGPGREERWPGITDESQQLLNDIAQKRQQMQQDYEQRQPAKMGYRWLTAGRAEDLHEYRNERHRQEVELEGLTGGHPADIADHFARGGKPLITYKDWLRARAGEADREPPVGNEVYTPDPSWGDDDVPAWAKMAAVTQDLVDRLKGEFADWTDQHALLHPNEHPRRLDYWPHVEDFLSDNYPAAHRGHDMGLETTRPMLDNTPISGFGAGGIGNSRPYQTGPNFEKLYGYDPKEIASGMLLLHNRTNEYRDDLIPEDEARLHDIFQKRQQMQRNYEQRQPVG